MPKTAAFKGLVQSYKDGTVKGWACQLGQEKSVKVELYLGGAKGTGKMIQSVDAGINDSAAPSLAAECGTQKAAHPVQR